VRRIRLDAEWFEGRGAVIRTARADYLCDVAGCRIPIAKGTPYAHLKHGLRIGLEHIEPTDLEDVP
jgi:hypothetical protein